VSLVNLYIFFVLAAGFPLYNSKRYTYSRASYKKYLQYSISKKPESSSARCDRSLVC